MSYASDLVTFVPGTDENFSVGITAASPITFYSSGYLRSFRGVSQGSFAATPTGSGGGGTPEPATWALMILGVAGIGFAARKKGEASALARLTVKPSLSFFTARTSVRAFFCLLS